MTETPAPHINYPDYIRPDFGSVTSIMDGVYWLQMPLPFDLNHINLYLIEDTDGWYVVDTGMGGETTQQHWHSIFAHHLNDKPVKGVIVTHLHPDHMGQAGWLTEHWRVPLYMTRSEYFMARALSSLPNEASHWPAEQYFARSGLDPETQQRLMGYEGSFHKFVEPLTRAYQRLSEGSQLTINQHNWQVMVGRGHSPEHACLYCEDLQLLISGDHILPKITPNISAYPTEPDNNPLYDYLETLKPFSELPENTLVLPAHGEPFIGLHNRINYTLAHHQYKFTALTNACQEAQSAAELLSVLFRKELKPGQIGLALGECLAHLNYLINEDQLERQLDNQGIYRYQSLIEPQELPAYPGKDDMSLQRV